ncbi:hypothetical protein ABZ419_02325 [Streptomyces cinnamoneus]|uniref:hypothetical protein n=1 Tax=Streptomyces cinnamoneus TaxID=53446 RepID=UPI003401C5E3
MTDYKCYAVFDENAAEDDKGIAVDFDYENGVFQTNISHEFPGTVGQSTSTPVLAAPDGKNIYACGTYRRVSAMDTKTGKCKSTPYESENAPQAPILCLAEDGKALYQESSGYLLRIDTQTMKPKPVEGISEIYSVITGLDQNLIYFTHASPYGANNSYHVGSLDLTTGKVSPVYMSGLKNPSISGTRIAVAKTPDGPQLFILVTHQKEYRQSKTGFIPCISLAVFDLENNTTVYSEEVFYDIALPTYPGHRPIGLTPTPDGKHVYIVGSTGKGTDSKCSVWIYDTQRKKISTSLPVGNNMGYNRIIAAPEGINKVYLSSTALDAQKSHTGFTAIDTVTREVEDPADTPYPFPSFCFYPTPQD